MTESGWLSIAGALAGMRMVVGDAAPATAECLESGAVAASATWEGRQKTPTAGERLVESPAAGEPGRLVDRAVQGLTNTGAVTVTAGVPGDRREVIASGSAWVPGTCGELVQGTIDGVSFHVTCPIDVGSRAIVHLKRGGVIEYPTESPKSGAALTAVLRLFGVEHLGGRLVLQSSLPRSKGMGSSTADIAATVFACARALRVPVSAEAVARLALDNEPTDGSLFPGIVLFDHRCGAIYEPLGRPPALTIVVLDFGGEVDTIEYNGVERRELLRTLEPEHVEALRLVRRGLREGRNELIGRGATLSALAHQAVLRKPQLPAVLEFATGIGALGVNVAHSGTVMGILLDANRQDAAEILRRVRIEFPDLSFSTVGRLVSGGWYW